MVVKRLLLILFFFIFLSQSIRAAGNGATWNDAARHLQLENRARKFETIFYYSEKIDSSVYQDGFIAFTELIESYLDRYQHLADRQDVEQALYYLERLKSIRLLLLWKSANLPDSIRSKQYQLLARQLVLVRAQAGEDREDSLAQKQPMLFKSSLQSFQDSVRAHDPNLYLLLLFQQPVRLAEIQKSYLLPNQILLDFWANRERLSLFMISTDSIAIFQYPMPAAQIKSQIATLMLPMHQKLDWHQLKFDIKLAYDLFHNLVKPLEPFIARAKEIIIIPDGFLTGFPFEMLVLDTTVQKNIHAKDALYGDMSELKFLMRQYAISYNYSIHALSPQWLEFQSIKNLGRRLLTMSEPIITSSSSYSSSQIDELYSQLQNVNDTNSEIKRVARLLWRHDIIKKRKATKNFFFKNGKGYRWIYLALPGILNNSNPSNSALLFTQDYSDTLVSTAWMTAGEVMKSKLSADLLTMSGCELLPFDPNENPGNIALPQAFLYAGAKSVVFNQWHVASQFTSEFMSKFYWELKYKRQTNAVALQQAKLASLKNSFVISDQKISGANPHFWAAYVLVGNPNIRAPYKERIPQWGIIILVYIALILVAFYITQKTRQT